MASASHLWFQEAKPRQSCAHLEGPFFGMDLGRVAEMFRARVVGSRNY